MNAIKRIINAAYIDNIDLLAPFRCALFLWLGFTGRVDWWILFAIVAWSQSVKITFKKE